MGQRFGRLVVEAPAGHDRFGARLWTCRCDCGKIANKSGGGLRHGRIRSCGCMKVEHCKRVGAKNRKHGAVLGGRRSQEYISWQHMHDRCTNPNAHNYEYYGGRGITVCPEWSEFGTFLSDMGRRPPDATLDRKENDGNYSPDNCRWATKSEQNSNRRFWTRKRG